MVLSEIQVYEGTIKKYGYIASLKDYYFTIEDKPNVVLRNHKGSKVNRMEYIGKEISYVITNSENGCDFGKIVTTNKLIASLNKSMDWLKTGKILKVNNRGAIIDIDGENYELLNRDSFRDSGRLVNFFIPGNILYNIELYDVDNTAENSFHYEEYFNKHKDSRLVKKNARLKFKLQRTDFVDSSNEYLTENTEFEGVIKVLNPTSCHVLITKDAEVFCEVPDYIDDDFKVGDRVLVKVSKIKDFPDKKKIVGRVIDLIC